MFIIIKVIFKKPIVEKRLLQKMQSPPRTPPHLTLPPAVCPYVPVKKEKNTVSLGFSVSKELDSTFKKVEHRFTTPPPTRRTEPPKLVRKKK